MYQSEFTGAIDKVVSDVKYNLETLRSIGGSLESIRVSIESDGMSRDLAELMEQHVPGMITKKTRINGFTSYPSTVGRTVALESIFSARNLGLGAMIAAVTAAVVALIARFVKWINEVTRGPKAKARAKRAHSRDWTAESDHLGANVPGWDEDPVFQADNRALQESCTRLLVYVAQNNHEILMRSLIGPAPRTLVEYLSGQIALDIKSIQTLSTTLLAKPAVGDGITGNDALVASLKETLMQFEGNLRTTENLVFPGLVGDSKSPLSARLIETRDFFEHMGSEPNAPVRETTKMENMDAIRVTISKASKAVENLRMDKTNQTLVNLMREMSSVKNAVKVKLGTGSERALEIVTDMLAIIQVELSLLADCVGIISALVGSVETADTASVAQMKSAIDALSRAGVKFSDNDPRFAKERKFKDMVDSLT